MIAIFGLLVIIIISITIVRIGAIALELTGISPEIASFQAQSAFSRAGFTTSESESIVSHPVRRRIIRVLILSGSAGITTSVGTFILSFIGSSGRDLLRKGLVLIFGLMVIFLFVRSKYIYNFMKKIIKSTLQKWTDINIYDYEQLLGFKEGYSISRLLVKDDCWLSNKRLNELRLDKKGVLLLGIYRKEGGKERFIGGPTGETIIQTEDVLICYSKHDVRAAFAQSCDESSNREV